MMYQYTTGSWVGEGRNLAVCDEGFSWRGVGEGGRQLWTLIRTIRRGKAVVEEGKRYGDSPTTKKTSRCSWMPAVFKVRSLFSAASRPTLGSNRPPIQQMPKGAFLRGKDSRSVHLVPWTVPRLLLHTTA